MTLVVPSEVIAFIDATLPESGTNPTTVWSLDHMPQLACLVRLVDSIPEQLLILEGTDRVEFVVALEALRNGVAAFHSHGGSFQLRPLRGVSPVTALYRLIRKCPDQFPSPDVAQLVFIGDQQLRDTLRRDLNGINRALTNGEWKAATVLAGSVTEALLLWSIEQRTQPEIEAIRTRVSGRAVKSSPPNQWTLDEYAQAAVLLEHIENKTATLVTLAKDFRNLIHPGREIRTGIRCDRGTALAAVAAVEHVTRDLERWDGQRHG